MALLALLVSVLGYAAITGALLYFGRRVSQLLLTIRTIELQFRDIAAWIAKREAEIANRKRQEEQ